MPRDAVSRTANVERNDGHKWVQQEMSHKTTRRQMYLCLINQMGIGIEDLRLFDTLQTGFSYHEPGAVLVNDML